MPDRSLLLNGAFFLLTSFSSFLNLVAQQPAGPAANFRTTSRIVYVDVVVRDSAGHVVHGLDQGSFTLKENGRPQHLDLFEEHKGAGPKAAASAARGEFSNLPANGLQSSLNLVLLDLLDTTPTEQAYARERMIRFLRALPPGKQVALFVL